MPLPVRPHALVLTAFGLCLALSTSCSSDSHPENPAGPPAAVADFPPVLAGTENFADGKVAVRVTLALPSAFRPGGEGGHKGGGRSGHRGGGRRGGGMRGSASGMEGTEPSSDGPSDDRPRPSVMGSNLPPAQLKLFLQNTSTTDAVVCEITDFNSTLGNFAVFPSTYHIEAGQSASSETMTSRLGVEGDEIPVTVALKVHDHVEKKVITLRPIAAPDAPAPSPTAK